jgi:hypothetical protein
VADGYATATVKDAMTIGPGNRSVDWVTRPMAGGQHDTPFQPVADVPVKGH